MNKKLILGIALVIGLAAVTTFLVGREGSKNLSASYSVATSTPIASRIISRASWVSKAMTVDELMLESDLVVRVRVSKAPVTRILRHELPVWDENNKVVGSTISETLFSDTTFEIIKTYWGKSPSNITVVQTGGFDPAISKSVEEMIDDPLYKVGEEYILFLVDISGDKVQAPDRELYRIVNPFGRYRINGGNNVFSYGQNPKADAPHGILDIRELEAQIEQAIDLTPSPT
jgi:hypothetical protein